MALNPPQGRRSLTPLVRERITRAVKAFVALVVVMTVAVGSAIYFQSSIASSDPILLWIQTFAGNWSPPEKKQGPTGESTTPATSTERKAESSGNQATFDNSLSNGRISDTLLVTTGAVGLLLNVGSLLALFKILWDVGKIGRRNLMNLNQAYEFRDVVLKTFAVSAINRLISEDKDITEDKIETVLESAFERANKLWKEKYLTMAVGAEAAKHLTTVGRNIT